MDRVFPRIQIVLGPTEPSTKVELDRIERKLDRIEQRHAAKNDCISTQIAADLTNRTGKIQFTDCPEPTKCVEEEEVIQEDQDEKRDGGVLDQTVTCEIILARVTCLGADMARIESKLDRMMADPRAATEKQKNVLRYKGLQL